MRYKAFLTELLYREYTSMKSHRLRFSSILLSSPPSIAVALIMSARIIPSRCPARTFITAIYLSALGNSALNSSSNSPLILAFFAKNSLSRFCARLSCPLSKVR